MCCVTGEREKKKKKRKEREKKNEQVLPSDSADGVRQQGAAARGGWESERIILGGVKGRLQPVSAC